MSRGKGTKSNLKGRISGYETADFKIVNTKEQKNMWPGKSENLPSMHRGKKKKSLIKKIGIILSCIIIIPVVLLLILGAFISSHDDNYVEPKVITPQSSSIKPTTFTQRQLDAEGARDIKIAKLLTKGWDITDNAVASNYYITVGKKWEAVSSNPSPILEIKTSHQYEAKDQKYETSAIKIQLQESKEHGGITVDNTLINILRIYDPAINIDSIKSSVESAYKSTVNSKSYEGSLSFDKDRVYINGSKSGQLINVTIDFNTSISIN